MKKEIFELMITSVICFIDREGMKFLLMLFSLISSEFQKLN